jgi:uncharacterized protein (DUF427 family)
MNRLEDPMPRAVWNDIVIAESDRTELMEGYHYFPPESVRREYLQESRTVSICPWKGAARYYHVLVGGQVGSDAAWSYPEPTEAAMNIKGLFAFWKGVRVEA